MKKITKNALKSLIVGSALAFVAVLSPLAAPATFAACDPASGSIKGGVDCAQGNSSGQQLFGDDSVFSTVVNVLLFLIGAISVIMLIVGGIRYTISGGDSGAVTSAKNTIMYAIIGLIIAFLAFALVNWVLTAIGG